jgi:cation transport regulator ChaC
VDVIHYFAYGSNMNPERVRLRSMEFDHHQAGLLQDYRLAFNKRSVKHPGSASANVMQHFGSATEGVVYRLQHPDQIIMMDPYEGYPHRYDRFPVPITCHQGIVEAWVYVANEEHVTEGLKPNRWYLEHLLAGREFLSTDYFDLLASVECLPDSHIEPE